jgi:hypothetical protein
VIERGAGPVSDLEPGDVFNTRRSDKGIAVRFFKAKSQEKKADIWCLAGEVPAAVG